MTTTGANNTSRQRPRSGKGRFVRTPDTAERDAQACRLRTEGHTFDEIATALGYTDRAAAHRAVERALTATVAEPAAQVRALELARLDRMWREAWAVLTREHVTVSQGRVVTIDDEPIPDDGPVLQAIDRLLKIQDRRAKLLGLDAPTKVEAVTVDMVEAEIARLAAELGERAGEGVSSP